MTKNTGPEAQKGHIVCETSHKSKAKTERFYMDGEVYNTINKQTAKWVSMFLLILYHEGFTVMTPIVVDKSAHHA